MTRLETVARASAAFLAIAGCAENRGEPPASPLLEPGELRDEAAIARARAHVTKEHSSVARRHAQKGDALVREERFGPATKAYGEAFIFDPLPTYLLSHAAANVRTPRYRDASLEVVVAERGAIARAVTELELVERLGAKTDVADRAARFRACLGQGRDRAAAANCCAAAGIRP